MSFFNFFGHKASFRCSGWPPAPFAERRLDFLADRDALAWRSASESISWYVSADCARPIGRATKKAPRPWMYRRGVLRFLASLLQSWIYSGGRYGAQASRSARITTAIIGAVNVSGFRTI
jgi:hypothetical protein